MRLLPFVLYKLLYESILKCFAHMCFSSETSINRKYTLVRSIQWSYFFSSFSI